jgi:hypothetical protein
VPLKRDPQRILGLVRLLGELYNYSVISAPVIYELLYTVINHSHRIELNLESSATNVPATLAEAPHKYDPRILSDLDPPGIYVCIYILCIYIYIYYTYIYRHVYIYMYIYINI